jgi:hypothetical protein
MVSQTPTEIKAGLVAILFVGAVYTIFTRKPPVKLVPTTTVVPSIVVTLIHTAMCFGYAAMYPEVEENAKLCAIGAAVLTAVTYLLSRVMWHGLIDGSPAFCLFGNITNQFLIMPGLLYMAWATKDPALSNTEWLAQPWGGVSDPAFRYETWLMYSFCAHMVKDIPWLWSYNGHLIIEHHLAVYFGTVLFLDELPLAGRYVILVMVCQEVGSGLFNVFTLSAYQYQFQKIFPLLVFFSVGAFISNVVGLLLVYWHCQLADYSAWWWFFGVAGPIIAVERQNHVTKHIRWYYSAGPGSVGVKKTA